MYEKSLSEYMYLLAEYGSCERLEYDLLRYSSVSDVFRNQNSLSATWFIDLLQYFKPKLQKNNEILHEFSRFFVGLNYYEL